MLQLGSGTRAFRPRERLLATGFAQKSSFARRDSRVRLSPRDFIRRSEPRLSEVHCGEVAGWLPRR